MEKPTGFNELHEQALAVLPTHEIAYTNVKPLIDVATGYATESNGAYQILSDLAEWGFVTRRMELIKREGSDFICGSVSFFRKSI